MPVIFQLSLPTLLVAILSIWWLQFLLKGNKDFFNEYFELFKFLPFDSFVRYLAVNSSSSMAKTKVAIILSFILALIWPLAPIFGWSYYSLEGGLTSCSVEWSDKDLSVVTYNMTIFVTVFLVPIIIIITANSLLVLKVIFRYFKLMRTLL